MKNKWSHITPPVNSFAGVPVCTNLDELETDIAIIGLHYVSPYPNDLPLTAVPSGKETAPDAIRQQSALFTNHLDHYDFDFNDTLLGDGEVRIVDCGDVDLGPENPEQKQGIITEAVRAILDRGAVPIGIGTDEGGLIPALHGFKDTKDLCVVHIDAHIDWIDERDGVREGYSSGMRRASEMEWVKSIAQVGLRGIGSAKRKEVEDAAAFGSVFIRAREVHEKGMTACLERIPLADNYFITIDSDVLDIAIAPGVLFTSPGGLTFDETSDLVRGLATRGRIAGINLFEVRPERDINHLTASTAAQLIINFIGALVHTGQVGNANPGSP